MLSAVNGCVRDLYPPGSLLSLSVVYGSMESSGSELQLTGLRISPAARMDRPPTSDTHTLRAATETWSELGCCLPLIFLLSLSLFHIHTEGHRVLPVVPADLQTFHSHPKHGGSSRDDLTGYRLLLEFILASL